MRLYIKVEDGKAVNHPITEQNILYFHADFDPNNLPPNLERFNRIPPPEIGRFEKLIVKPYEKWNGVWSDVYEIQPFSEEEKNQEIQRIRNNFRFIDTWTFDEEKYEWVPPVPYPDDGKNYLWDNDKVNWVLINN